MRRQFLILGLGTLLAICRSTSSSWADESSPISKPFVFRVMTYNVHHGEGSDGRLDLDRIAQIIRNADCDLVALQELDRHATRTEKQDQLWLLAEKTQMKPFFAKAIDLGSGEYGVGILSRLPVTAHQVHRLPSDAQREQRVACEVRVEPAAGTPFVFISTHLDHSPDDHDRRRQVAALHQLFGHGPSAAILAGDLNTTWDHDVMKPLRDHWIEGDEEKRPTSPANEPQRKIDHICVTREQGWAIRKAMVIDEPVASDHRPLVVELSFTAAGGTE